MFLENEAEKRNKMKEALLNMETILNECDLMVKDSAQIDESLTMKLLYNIGKFYECYKVLVEKSEIFNNDEV